MSGGELDARYRCRLCGAEYSGYEVYEVNNPELETNCLYCLISLDKKEDHQS